MEELWIYGEQGLRILLALVLSGWIGYDRSKKSRAAGLRTHALVGTASALVMLTSEFIYVHYSPMGASPDPARLGAQIISGIGFLGAGTIIQGRGSVKGLTTAASLWGVGTIGIAAGIGFYYGAILTTVIFYVLLRFATFIESGMVNRIETKRIFIQTQSNDLNIFEQLALQHNVFVDKVQYMGSDILEDKKIHYILITLNPRQKNMDKYRDLMRTYGSLEGVVKLKVVGETIMDEEFD